MKKLFLLFFVFCLTGILPAGNTQFAIFAMGKDSLLKAADSGAVSIREKSKVDKKTGTKQYSCLYFNISAKSNKETKSFKFKIEAAKGDLLVYIGHARADKLMWTSIKLDGKEQVKDPKKGELIGSKKFSLGKIDAKKTIEIEASYRVPTKKELQADKKTVKKSSKKSSKKSTKK